MFFVELCLAVPANTLIQNQASASYTIGGSTNKIFSNLSSFHVLEVLDHTLVSNHPSGVLSLTPDSSKVLSFTLTNIGNGQDSYVLSPSQMGGDEFDPTNIRIYLDLDNNNIFNLAVDPLYIPGVNDPVLSIGGVQNIFIVSDIPSSLNSGDEGKVSLNASSNTGTGAVGTLISGGGDGGVDALIGSAQGSVDEESFYYISQTTVSVNKSQKILDPTGHNAPSKGAVITYTLDIELQGNGLIKNARLSDPIPSGTTYVPGSMELEGTILTDLLDLDAGNFDGTQVIFNLGNQNAPKTIQAKFKVEVN